MNNLIKIKVSGKNVKNYLKRLNDHQINIYKINYLNKEIEIFINEKNEEKAYELKTIYELEKLDEFGIRKLFQKIEKNFILIIFLILNVIFINYLANYIYKVEIIENKVELKKYINQILVKNNIKPYAKKKSYKTIEKIKNKILLENKDHIEWIEIIESGVKYIVKVEERIKKEDKEEFEYQNIVASKEGIVKKIIALNGQVVVAKNDYVKKGDVLISGIIRLNGEEKNMTKASGVVYAETWYKVKTSEELYKNVHEITDECTKGFKLQFFNKSFKFYSKYKYEEIKEKIWVRSIILPIYISYDNSCKINYVNALQTYEEAKDQAILKARLEIEKNLKDEEKIISFKQLQVDLKDSKIIVETLFSVLEQISEIEEIEGDNVQGNT